MYSPGFRAEGLRLAQDLQVKVVGPLDGIAPSALDGGQLAVDPRRASADAGSADRLAGVDQLQRARVLDVAAGPGRRGR